MSLFQTVDVVLHSGEESDWKIECDTLTDEDMRTLAKRIAELVHPFGEVEGVPRGGLRLASALKPYRSAGGLLIVDDVLTTGGSMEAHRAGRDAKGAVIFARGESPAWVTPLFAMPALDYRECGHCRQRFVLRHGSQLYCDGCRQVGPQSKYHRNLDELSAAYRSAYKRLDLYVRRGLFTRDAVDTWRATARPLRDRAKQEGWPVERLRAELEELEPRRAPDG